MRRGVDAALQPRPSRRRRRAWSLVPAIVLVLAGLAPSSGAGPGYVPNAEALTGDPVVAAAGDIACDPTNTHFHGGDGDSNACRQKYTSNQLVNGGFAAVLALGDNQYYCGGYGAFLQSYDLSWGRLKSVTRPVVGNHEYLTSGGTGCDQSNEDAAGYFRYYGAKAGQPGQGYYSYDVGAWHIVALNSNCGDIGGCSSGSPQYTWLANDLAAHPTTCTLAYWHIPLFSSGGRDAANMRSIWTLLYNDNADLVLSGHDHIYERFGPQTSAGVLDPARGIRSFIVGTGGANHTSIESVAANSEKRNASTFGILKLTLHSTSYNWAFSPEVAGSFSDTGSASCHDGASDTTPPSVPQNLTAMATSGPAAALSWSPSTDNVAVTSYGVYRNGTQLGVTSGTSYTDSGVATGATYRYTVDARDAAGNRSAQSTAATLTIPSNPPLVFTPTADAYVGQDQPSANFGTATTLQIDGSPLKRALFRFSVSGVGTAGIASAKLRVYCTNASGVGGQVRSVVGSWTETGVTWNTSPSLGSSTISSFGAVAAGRWYEVDVTPLVSGNGTVDIGLLSTSADGAFYGSREGTASQRPQLVVTPKA